MIKLAVFSFQFFYQKKEKLTTVDVPSDCDASHASKGASALPIRKIAVEEDSRWAEDIRFCWSCRVSSRCETLVAAEPGLH